jgi:hypothetical protein
MTWHAYVIRRPSVAVNLWQSCDETTPKVTFPTTCLFCEVYIGKYKQLYTCGAFGSQYLGAKEDSTGQTMYQIISHFHQWSEKSSLPEQLTVHEFLNKAFPGQWIGSGSANVLHQYPDLHAVPAWTHLIKTFGE